MIEHVKMQRGDEIADVATIEIEIWQAIGFEVIYADGQTVSETNNETEKTKTEAQTETPVKRRGRPRKVS